MVHLFTDAVGAADAQGSERDDSESGTTACGDHRGRRELRPAISRAMNDSMLDRPIEVAVESCVFRGIADFAHQASGDLLELNVVQSAVAVNGAFYRQTLGFSGDMSSLGRGDNELLLDHVTAAVERPLVLVELGDREVTRPIRFDCRSSLIKVTDAAQPLVSWTDRGTSTTISIH